MSEELRDILVKVVHEEYVDQAEQAILALMDKRFEAIALEETMMKAWNDTTYLKPSGALIDILADGIRARWEKIC